MKTYTVLIQELPSNSTRIIKIRALTIHLAEIQAIDLIADEDHILDVYPTPTDPN